MPTPESYLEKIEPIFLKYGANTLSIDQIATKIGITKKTLYNNFGNREDVIKALIDLKFSRLRETLISAASEPHNSSIKVMLEIMISTNNLWQNWDGIFLLSLHEALSDTYIYMVQKSLRTLNEFFALNIPKGRSEGLFRADFDMDDIASFINNAFTSTQKESANSSHNTIFVIIRGMTTPNGTTILDQELKRLIAQ